MKKKPIFSLLVILLLLCMSAVCIPKALLALSVQPEKQLTFVIDPGHGGEDGGAVAQDGTKESSINLSIALRLESLLHLFGERTVMTRREDMIAYPAEADTTKQRKMADLRQRVTLIRSTSHAVLISIHQNKYSAPSVHGAQVFYGTEHGSEAFAVYTQNMLSVLGENKRKAAAMDEEIYLIREAGCPAILVECGFLSNPTELERLKQDSYQTKIAVCLLASCLGQRQELEQVYGEG